MINRLSKKLSLINAKKINEHCKDFIERSLLDVGAGRCYIAETIREKNKVDVHCADIQDKNRTNLRLTVYDGKRMPFKDNKFGTVLLCYVLHHCEEPETVLKECIRVCKKNIIIFEDSDPSFFTKGMDYLFNIIRGVKTPLNFKTVNQWVKLFKGMNLKILKIEKNVEKEWFYPFVKHTMFVLRKI